MYFFFFKQKTAYEMRISDWSSDVCSSDLAHRLRLRGARASADRRDKRRTGATEIFDAAFVPFVSRRARALRRARPRRPARYQRLHAAQGATEIGRASCRERVCQYV